MSLETIFFSYSRVNEDFVLDLGKKFRAAGVRIWIDQLDTKAGEDWCEVCDEALLNSGSVVLVLSKTSVDSTNVLDEVSFALEEKKPVILLLLQDCDIPFRIKKLPLIDFRTNQNEVLIKLVQALKLNPIIAKKLTANL